MQKWWIDPDDPVELRKPGPGFPAIGVTLSTLNDEPPTNLFNDGRCDSCGRFLAGTMDMEEKGPTGSLYSFDGKSITKLVSNVTISNGMTWSPDYKTFYYIDTPRREVKAFDYDLEPGRWQIHAA